MDALDEQGDDEDEGEAALVAQVHTGLASRMRWTLWTRSASKHDLANLHQKVHAQEQLGDVDDAYRKRNLGVLDQLADVADQAHELDYLDKVDEQAHAMDQLDKVDE